MTNYIVVDGQFYSEAELYHSGVKGMKRGVRRYQNPDGSLTPLGRIHYGVGKGERTKHDSKKIAAIDRVDSMYDHSNKWNNRLADKLEKKGSTKRAAVLREMTRQNELARKEKTKQIAKTDAETYSRMRKEDFKSVFFGGQKWAQRNNAHMTTYASRRNEYDQQRAMRWTLRFMSDNDLAKMSVKQAYEHVNKVTRANQIQQETADLATISTLNALNQAQRRRQANELRSDRMRRMSESIKR